MRKCECGTLIVVGRLTRCHVCIHQAQAQERRKAATGERSDWAPFGKHAAWNREPGRGAVSEAEAILRAHWMEHSGEGFGE